jgi:AbrB family looped-hinge helix DNA binding protein
MVVRGSSKITRKGQVTIPAAIREASGFSEGDEVDFSYDEATGQVTMEERHSFVDRTAGILWRPGMPGLSDEDLKQAVEDAAQAAAIERDERSKRG